MRGIKAVTLACIHQREHRELPSEEKPDKSIESSSNQTGDKGLDAVDPSIESSSNQTGGKGLDAIDSSIGSSSSQEGIKSLGDKEAEAWLANTKSLFDERTKGPKKWGDLSEEGNQDKSDKGSKVLKDTKDSGSNGSTTDENDDDPKEVNDNPGSTPLLTIPPAEGSDARYPIPRGMNLVIDSDGNERLERVTDGEEANKSLNKTQIQECRNIS
jgi:hypothetical protein